MKKAKNDSFHPCRPYSLVISLMFVVNNNHVNYRKYTSPERILTLSQNQYNI